VKNRCLLVAFTVLVPSVAFLACKGSTEPKLPALDGTTAQMWAWDLESAVGLTGPSMFSSASQTWSNQVVSGSSGTAVVNGSVSYSYDGVDPASISANSVTIQFNKYCTGDGTCVTGTVTVNGTCTTTYGWHTSYSGYWQVTGQDIDLSSPQVAARASITMRMYADPGHIFDAFVVAGDSTWAVSAP
jgi:hypothetical protein